MRFSFRFRPIPFVATILVVWLGISLGNWQADRAREKEALELQLSLRESAPAIELSAEPMKGDVLEYRHVRIKGEFIRDWPIYLDNRAYKGTAGFYVLMPFKMAQTNSYVLVARGWLPRDLSDRTKVPPLLTSQGEIELDGIVVSSVGKLFRLGKDDPVIRPGAIVQNVTPAALAAQTHWKLQNFYIQQRNDTADKLVRDWPRPALDIDRHRGYRVTWYALALMAAIFYLATGLRRKNESK